MLLAADVVFVTVSHRAIARWLCRLFLLAAVIIDNRWCDHKSVIIATAFGLSPFLKWEHDDISSPYNYKLHCVSKKQDT